MGYTVRPEEHELEKAKNIVEESLGSSRAIIEKEGDFEVSLGWMAVPSAAEDFNGASGGSGDEEFIFVEFNSTVEDWKEDLKHVTAYSYGRSLFLELADYSVGFGWQELIIEAFALHFLERVYGGAAERDLEWSREELEEAWPDVRESLDEESVWFDAEDPIWDSAYFIGQELLEENELEELPGLKRSDVIDAGDRIFT